MNSLPNTVTSQRRDCDLNLGPSAPESSTLTTRLRSHPVDLGGAKKPCIMWGNFGENLGTSSEPSLVELSR